MSDPSVDVNLWKGRLFITSSYSPGPGTYVGKEPVFEVCPYHPAEIGKAVRKGLASFEDNGPWPVDWESCQSPTLAAAGVSSWNEFNRGLRDVSVRIEGDQYHIYTERPHIFLPLTVTDEELGNAALEALGTSAEKERRKAERRKRKT